MNLPKELLVAKDFFKEISEHNVVAIIHSGSKLHGTDNLTSDTDFVGLYIPSKESLYFKNDPMELKFESNSMNNSNKDTDIKLISIYKFLQDLDRGDINSIDLLFSLVNQSNFLFGYENELIVHLRKNIKELFVGNYYSMIGFSIAQVSTYSNKGKRFNDLSRAIELLETLPMKKSLEDSLEDLKPLFELDNIFLETKLDREYISILDRLYDKNFKVKYVLNELIKIKSLYGHRVKKNDSGADYKAYSHALRALYEAKELIETNDLKFPLSERNYLKEIKEGKINDIEKLTNEIFKLHSFVDNHMRLRPAELNKKSISQDLYNNTIRLIMNI